MPHCSVPKPFKSWFDTRFTDLCDWHDEQYVKRVWRDKVVADMVVTAEFAKRGYLWVAYGSIFYFGVFGTILWVWKKYK